HRETPPTNFSPSQLHRPHLTTTHSQRLVITNHAPQQQQHRHAPAQAPSPQLQRLPLPETRDPATEYLQHDNSSTFLFLFLLFFLLFLAALVYNCYMQYLPGPCLRLRAALLGSQKKPQPDYLACEAGLMEPVTVDKLDVKDQIRLTQNGVQLRALRDTGYETEPECSNGKVPSRSYGGEDSPSKEKPFDVDCDSQPIEYADADQEASPY
ncbi:semaphorin-4D-like, partial [Oncorhynchus nerka]|uniref:semaphorin-4D-like n=1 Tax=Oncorhynchus nerka TaxID=8023 RepID=UPI0031B81FE6